MKAIIINDLEDLRDTLNKYNEVYNEVHEVDDEKEQPLTFNSKKEFAQAILEYGELFDGDELKYYFKTESDGEIRFYVEKLSGSYSGEITGLWHKYNRNFYTQPPEKINKEELKDKDLVVAWDSTGFPVIGVYYKTGDSIHTSPELYGVNFENYEKIHFDQLPPKFKKYVKKHILSNFD